jgi:hypothetical protein
MRDNREGRGLAGSDPARWARPSRLMEQMRRQALQMVHVGEADLLASVRRMLDFNDSLIQRHGLVAPMASKVAAHATGC